MGYMPNVLAALKGLALDERWEFKKMGRLLARPDLLDAIEDQAAELDDLWQPDPEYFEIRAKYLLY